jgi:NADH-ubiquinone oxidoreductase chain 5
MILSIIILPLISFLLIALFARIIGRKGSVLLATIIMFVNVILTVILFYEIGFKEKLVFIKAGAWIYSDLLQVDWGFYVDNLTLVMLFVVNVISALVHLYSAEYMAHDPHLPRFMSYLSLFTFFMLMLVTGDNLVILFLGWEGVGLCSYLLISFWHTRLQANKAAIKALIVNRIADFALTIGLVSIFFVFKSLDVHVIFALAPFFLNSTLNFLGFQLPVLMVICSLLFIGAMGKSAQIGLHTWLPDAMEGPTPVSALIHAATMVTAGVFLIIKCSPIFEYVPSILSVITFVGAITAFFSATVGLVQNDIKKVIAYSTCSQLGYMIFSCGLSMYHVSLFHLANHAFFKALLFLSAGAIIHSLSNEQDMRKFGALGPLLPFTAIMFLIGSLSLMGFPFLTGFYSKDLILELALTKYTLEGSFAYNLGLITAFFTSFYSFRVFYMTFIYKTNTFRTSINKIHELPWKMALPLGILSLGSIFLGYVSKDLFVGLGTDFWNNSIFILPEHNNQLDAEFFGLSNLSIEELQPFWNLTYNVRWIKLVPFFSSLFAVALVCLIFSDNFWNENVKVKKLSLFLANQKNQTFSKAKNKFEKENLTPEDVEEFMQYYTPQGYLKIYNKTGEFTPIYPVDDPRVPALEIVNNRQYHYYQKIIMELQNRYNNNSDIKSFYIKLYQFLIHKWYFDAIYNEIINRPVLLFAYNIVFRYLDKGILELFGPYGSSYILFSIASNYKLLFQQGVVYNYAFIMLLTLMACLSLDLMIHYADFQINKPQAIGATDIDYTPVLLLNDILKEMGFDQFFKKLLPYLEKENG